MTPSPQPPARFAIACGGTGGHLFPGLAVAGQLLQRGCAVTLLISTKQVDREAAQMAEGMEIVTLPAVGLQRGSRMAFARGFIQSYRSARKLFRARPPQAVIAMGGFTSAPPILAARSVRARTFLHESNAIPGRANRWLSWIADQVFVGFPSAAPRLHTGNVTVTGTPVRPQFQPSPAAPARKALGLDPARPVLLIMGGSQGASGINSLIINILPLLAKSAPDLQYLHLTGPANHEEAERAYRGLNLACKVFHFLPAMDAALSAATAAVSRAGASSLAELAAMRVPAILIPYPHAADNHQFHNARAFESVGAARLVEQRTATPETLAPLLLDLIQNSALREQMRSALERCHAPRAAEQISEAILKAVGLATTDVASTVTQSGSGTCRSPRPVEGVA